jgi:hypothetical protein
MIIRSPIRGQYKIAEDGFVINKSLRIIKISLLTMGVGGVVCEAVIAEMAHGAGTTPISQCQSSLERFRSHLANRTKSQNGQPYYESLYRQIDLFLNALKDVPLNSAQLNKCENLLDALREIVGSHGIEADLAPMPIYSNPQGGTLSTPAPERSLRKVVRKHIQYEDANPALKHIVVDDEEEGEALEPLKEPNGHAGLPHKRKSSQYGELDEHNR